MSTSTNIEWADATWSPLRVQVKADAAEIARAKGYASLIQIAEKMAGHVGQHCEHVSDGCKLCYSGTNQARCLPANGTGLPFDRRARDLVDPFVDENVLLQPLKWRTSKRIFVENQSDLFGEWYTDEQIDRVFAVMALCPQHTFQVLTKRPERMLAYFSENHGHEARRRVQDCISRRPSPEASRLFDGWPLSNVWLGVSVENQATADARIPLLLRTPAAKRFVSYEPALGPVDFTSILWPNKGGHRVDVLRRGYWNSAGWIAFGPSAELGNSRGGFTNHSDMEGIDWVIVGGESGPRARPFDIAWARNTIAQCKAAGVPCFVKQLGAKPYDRLSDESRWLTEVVAQWPVGTQFHTKHPGQALHQVELNSGKGGDMSEWPEDLRVREFPEATG